jgi:hypothetical protein
MVAAWRSLDVSAAAAESGGLVPQPRDERLTDDRDWRLGRRLGGGEVAPLANRNLEDR